MLTTKVVSSARDFHPLHLASASPFVFSPHLTLEHAGTSSNEMLDLTAKHLAILNILRAFLSATSYQVADILNGIGGNITYPDCAKLLNCLADASLVDRMKFSNSVFPGRTVYFFKLSKRGGALLYSKGFKTKLLDYTQDMPDVCYLRFLSVNQFISKKLNNATIIERVKVAKALFVESDPRTYIVRPQAIYQSDDATYLLESVRTKPGWEEELRKKLARYEGIINHKGVKSERIVCPKVVIIAESTVHMEKIMHETCNSSLDLIYTSDDLVYNKPNECLYEIVKARKTFLLEGLLKKVCR